jgi:ribosomal protein S18 acetylase RimI-like enzyme
VRRALGDGFELDDDRERVDLDAVHAFISGESYWGRGRPREVVRRAILGSLRVVGLYRGAEQAGFGRAVSDATTLAYLADVYVLAPYRGRGLGLELVREIVDGGEGGEGGNLSRVHWMLHTADAEGLYERLGFRRGPIRYPLMERARGYDSSP